MNRLERLSNDIKHHICDIISRHVKDPRLGFITITEVKVSPDMHHAKIYFTVLGEGKEKKDSQDAINSASGFIRKELASCMNIRYTPELDFRLDEAKECSKNIDDIFKKIQQERKEKGQDVN